MFSKGFLYRVIKSLDCTVELTQVSLYQPSSFMIGNFVMVVICLAVKEGIIVSNIRFTSPSFTGSVFTNCS